MNQTEATASGVPFIPMTRSESFVVRPLPSDHPLVQATAQLLSDDPDLTNAHLLRKLPAVAGAAAVQEVSVTHFQRRVREPAERLLRQQVMNVAPGHGRSNGRKPSAAPHEGSPEGEGRSSAKGRGPSRGPSPETANGGPGDAQPQEEAREAEDAKRNRARGSAGISRARKEMVDKALLKGFELGAAAASHAELVDAYRELQEIRQDLQAYLDGTPRREPSL